jgi:hypothetical protein
MTTVKEEYHLKAKSGRTVMTFENPDRATQEGERRKLDVYRVTTVAELISR